MLFSQIIGLIELARLDKPIGIYLLLWPALLGLLLAGIQSESINFINYIIVIIGSVLVRSCGCVINDISDFKKEEQLILSKNIDYKMYQIILMTTTCHVKFVHGHQRK